MGGACSRKRDQLVNEDNLNGGVSGKYTKSGSSKWLGTSISRGTVDAMQGKQSCPSLMDLCIYKIREVCFLMNSFSKLLHCQWKTKTSFNCTDEQFHWLKDINKYSTFSMLPRDISQQIFDDLVCSQCLTDSVLEAFRDCALQVSFKALLDEKVGHQLL